MKLHGIYIYFFSVIVFNSVRTKSTKYNRSFFFFFFPYWKNDIENKIYKGQCKARGMIVLSLFLAEVVLEYFPTCTAIPCKPFRTVWSLSETAKTNLLSNNRTHNFLFFFFIIMWKKKQKVNFWITHFSLDYKLSPKWNVKVLGKKNSFKKDHYYSKAYKTSDIKWYLLPYLRPVDPFLNIEER